MIILCFLLSESFPYEGVWGKWISTIPRECRPKVYIHQSKMFTLCEMREYCTEVVDTVPTSWGTITLVMATLQLYRSLVRKQLTNSEEYHTVLLSGDSVPLKPYARWAFPPKKSTFCVFREATGGGPVALPNREIGVMYQTHQWHVLCKTHVEALIHREGEMRALPFHTIHSPDEFAFATTLSKLGYFSEIEFISHGQGYMFSHWHDMSNYKFYKRHRPVPHPLTYSEISQEEMDYLQSDDCKSLCGRKFSVECTVKGANVSLKQHLCKDKKPLLLRKKRGRGNYYVL